MQFFPSQSVYSQTLGLVESVDVAALLGQHPAGVVTIFLPNNGAYHDSYFSVFDAINFNESLVNKVALYHVVDSSLDYDTLLWLYPSSLATVSGLQLPVTIQGNLFFISQADATAWI
jgi:uncharacterized surface protein with fasciclin (FAS1) repeats